MDDDANTTNPHSKCELASVTMQDDQGRTVMERVFLYFEGVPSSIKIILGVNAFKEP